MIVWLTLYLGLISGRQAAALKVDAAVKSVRVTIDGAPAATLAAPWRGEVDFGPALLPHEIVAVGLDADGREIARASQFVNVPRGRAEIDVVLERNADGRPVRAKLVARHLAQEKPRGASMKLDEKALAVADDFTAKLPALDMLRPHVLTAEMRFADGTVAQREIVFGGEFAESADAQLTPVVAGSGENCFAPLRVRSIEEPAAMIYIVRDPDARPIKERLRHTITMDLHKIASLDRPAVAVLLSPVATHVAANEESTALFPASQAFDAARNGMLYLLTEPHDQSSGDAPRQWADAAAVAGVHASAGGRRRAVVLVVGDAVDSSDYRPAVVRRYLESLGVPLFVWSATGPRPDLAASWGEVEDVSAAGKLIKATEHLRRVLREQRIAWVEANPVAALRAAAKCAAR